MNFKELVKSKTTEQNIKYSKKYMKNGAKKLTTIYFN